MPHIHEKIDFAVSVLITHQNRVLMVHHDGLDLWLPVGGHIELDEDPEQAVHREAKEESGLDITLIGTKPDIRVPHGRMLLAPTFVDIHNITPTHRHIGMVYFARAQTDSVTLAEAEHRAIRWLSREDLNDETYALLPNIKYYAEYALSLEEGS